jgi:hypothetical protein
MRSVFPKLKTHEQKNSIDGFQSFRRFPTEQPLFQIASSPMIKKIPAFRQKYRNAMPSPDWGFPKIC